MVEFMIHAFTLVSTGFLFGLGFTAALRIFFVRMR